MRILISIIIILVLTSFSFSVSTKFFIDDKYDRLIKGEAKDVSITNLGEIILSPSTEKKATIEEKVIWTLISDGNNIYLGTGHEGKVYKYKINSNELELIFDSEEMEAMALALDRNKNLYIGTSPNGKIYKKTAEKGFSVFAELKETNIFAMIFDRNDNLIVGTGDEGRIYSIDKNGVAKVLYDTSEKSITFLALSEDGNILAGSYPNGILYKINSSGKGEVVYDTGYEQISSIIAEGDTIYFSAVGGMKQASAAAPVSVSPVPSEITAESKSQETSDKEIKTEKVPTFFPFQMQAKRSSKLYKLSKQGYAEEIYSSNEASIFCSLLNEKSKIIVSTSQNNSLIQIDDKDNYSLLISSDGVISSIIKDKNKIWFATSNPSALYSINSSYGKRGEYLSQALDTNSIATWGEISWIENKLSSTEIRCYTRTGNTSTPDETWSEWSQAYTNKEGERITSPKARFIQYKCELSTADFNKSPLLRNVSISYLEQNRAPIIEKIQILSPGVVLKKIPTIQQDKDKTEALQSESSPAQKVPIQISSPSQKSYEQGWLTVQWNSSDPNNDKLIYNIYYANIVDMKWQLLAENVEDNFYSWDTTMLADGIYLIKLEASDVLSNPKEFSLSSYKISEQFQIDNTQPIIKLGGIKQASSDVIINFEISDTSSIIKSVEYAFDTQKWYPIFPKDLVLDSKKETFELALKGLKKGSYHVIIRAKDKVKNTATKDISFEVK